ncbi:MAG: AI-2E family transporter [bacterium]|nr:AI-2E family transporter [bacterium]
MQSTNRTIVVTLSILAVIASAAVIYLLQSILIPFVLAGLLSIVYRPLVTKLRSWKIPMVFCLLAVLVVTGGALWGMYTIISISVDAAIEKAPEYQARIGDLTTQFNETVKKFSKMLALRPGTIKPDTWLNAGSVSSAAAGVANSLVAFAGDSVLILLFLIFMVPGGEFFPRKLRLAFDGVTNFDVVAVHRAVNEKVRRYLGIKTILNAVVAVLTYVILLIFDVDFAALIALITFLMHYLPNIGSFLSTVIPGVVALVQFGDFGQALLIVLILIVMQNIIGNIIEPKIMGTSLDLSPVLVLFALAFWGWMWGVVGMILSVPIMAVTKVVLENIPSTKPLAVLMSGTPKPKKHKVSTDISGSTKEPDAHKANDPYAA